MIAMSAHSVSCNIVNPSLWIKDNRAVMNSKNGKKILELSSANAHTRLAPSEPHRQSPGQPKAGFLTLSPTLGITVFKNSAILEACGDLNEYFPQHQDETNDVDYHLFDIFFSPLQCWESNSGLCTR